MEVVGDKGYHSNDTLTALADAEVRRYFSEPDRGRRNWKEKPEARQAVYSNRRRIRGEHGKELLRQRGELVERSFAHAMKRAACDGCTSRAGKYSQASADSRGGFNLSLVMRQLLGKGTPRGLQGASADAFWAFCGSGSRFWLAQNRKAYRCPRSSAPAPRTSRFLFRLR